MIQYYLSSHIFLTVSESTTKSQPATSWRCLFASLYDALVLLAICFLAMAIVTPFFDPQNSMHQILAGFYLLVIISTFYLWFWMHGGQTVGMRAWRLKLQTTNGQSINLAQGLFRIITAIPSWLGFGLFVLLASIRQVEKLPAPLQAIQVYAIWLCLFCLLWILFDNRPKSWRNRISQTEIRFTPKS